MNDNDKQIAREAAKKLLAWADGATLEWASGGVDIPHPQFIALHVLAGNTVRIRPPAAPPEPKPSPAMRRRVMNVWAIYRRYVLMQALILVSGWCSLHYAWGLEIKSWPVALAYLAGMSLGYPILSAYGMKQQRKGDTP